MERLGVYVEWEGYGKIPAQIQMFFRRPPTEDHPDGQIMVVVTAAEARPTAYSVLTRQVTLETNADNSIMLHVVAGDTLGHHTCMFPNAPDSNLWYELQPYEKWASKFIGFSQAETTMDNTDVAWDGDDDSDMQDE